MTRMFAGLLAVLLVQAGTAEREVPLHGGSRRLQGLPVFPVVDQETYFLGTNQSSYLADLNFHNFFIPEAISRSFLHNLVSPDGLLDVLMSVGYFADAEFRTNGLDYLLNEGAITQGEYTRVLRQVGRGSFSLRARPIAMLGLLADVASFNDYLLNWQIVVWNEGTMLGRVKDIALDYDLSALPGYSAAIFYASLDSFKLSCGGWYTLGRGDTAEPEEFALVPFEDLYDLAVDYVGANQPLPDYSRWAWVTWPAKPVGEGELILNGEFSNGLSGWSTYVLNQAANSVTASAGQAQFDVAAAGALSWHMQLYQTIVTPVEGEMFTLSADIQSVGEPRTVDMVVAQNGGSWTTFGASSCGVVPDAVTRCSVTATVTIAGAIKLVIQGGDTAVNFFVDNASASLTEGPEPTLPPIGTPSPASSSSEDSEPPAATPSPVSMPPPTLPPTLAPGAATSVEFVNGDFSNGLDGWEAYVKGTVDNGAITASAGEVEFSLDSAGEQAWWMQLFQVLTLPTAGQTFRMSADVRGLSETDRPVQMYMRQMVRPWTTFAIALDECVATSGVTTTCSIEAVIPDVSIPVKFCVQGGHAAGGFAVDNLTLTVVA